MESIDAIGEACDRANPTPNDWAEYDPAGYFAAAAEIAADVGADVVADLSAGNDAQAAAAVNRAFARAIERAIRDRDAWVARWAEEN